MLILNECVENHKCAECGDKKNNGNSHFSFFGLVLKFYIVVKLEEIAAGIIIIKHASDVWELFLSSYCDGQLVFSISDPSRCSFNKQSSHYFCVTVSSRKHQRSIPH